MIRRFVYDEKADAVVEVGAVKAQPDAAEVYAESRHEYDYQFTREASPEAARRRLEGELAKADRREWAHKRFGDERRWAR